MRYEIKYEFNIYDHYSRATMLLDVLKKRTFILPSELELITQKKVDSFPIGTTGTTLKKVYPNKFYNLGYTKLDVTAELIALQTHMFLNACLLKPFKALNSLTLGAAFSTSSSCTGFLISFVPRLMALSYSLVGYAAWGLGTMALDFGHLMLKLSLRVISSAINLVAAPLNYAHNLLTDIKDSQTPKKDLMLGAGILLTFTAIGLAIALQTGAVTAGAIGSTTLALTFFALAWPVTLGIGGIAVLGMIGVGIYSFFAKPVDGYTVARQHRRGRVKTIRDKYDGQSGDQTNFESVPGVGTPPATDTSAWQTSSM